MFVSDGGGSIYGQPSRRSSGAAFAVCLFLLVPTFLVAGCGGDDTESTEQAGGGRGGSAGGRGGSSGGGRGGGMGGFGGGDPAQATAIPVRVTQVERRRISDFLQTTGALEAENEVDIVARTAGPITELLTEEGRYVASGDVLARIDDRELSADLELARVTLNETKAAFDRAQRNFSEEIISAEAFEVTKARYESAKAQVHSREIQLSYTEIRAPFAGRVIERVIKQGEFVSNGTRMFRISDFEPLLCPVFLPEKDLVKVSRKQSALVSVEAFAGETFKASVLRINPVIDQTNGTFKVTLQVSGQNKLRPGMFGSVFLEVDAHEDALVVPKRALVLEGVGDTVYVIDGGIAARREVTLGFEEAAHVEVLSGLSGDEQVIVLGQDSLTDGTPVYVLEQESTGPEGSTVTRVEQPAPSSPSMPPGARGGRPGPGQPSAEEGRGDPGTPATTPAANSEAAPAEGTGGRGGQAPEAGNRGGGPRGRGGPTPDLSDPEVVKRIRERMKSFGLSDEQIDQRIEQMKNGERPPRPDGGRPSGGAGTSGARFE